MSGIAESDVKKKQNEGDIPRLSIARHSASRGGGLLRQTAERKSRDTSCKCRFVQNFEKSKNLLSQNSKKIQICTAFPDTPLSAAARTKLIFRTNLTEINGL